MQYKTKSCGYTIKFNAPDSVEEYDRKAGPNACLKDAVANVVYRSTLPKWQEQMGKFLEERTGIPREIDHEATERMRSRSKNPEKPIAPVYERFLSYNSRVRKAYETIGKDVAELHAWAQEMASRIPVDPAPARDSFGASKGHLAKAQDILEHDNGYVEAKVNKFLGMVPNFELVRDQNNRPELGSLAHLVARYVDALL
jgi:hypothetical protein